MAQRINPQEIILDIIEYITLKSSWGSPCLAKPTPNEIALKAPRITMGVILAFILKNRGVSKPQPPF